jgi:UDP-GlcNAc:undecaprenyl-phosphate GlcNAc-1-phosphate transferase
MLALTPFAGFFLAFLIALATTPFVVKLALRRGVVDKKTTGKIHAHEVPRLGGIAIAAGFYVPVLGLALRVNVYQGNVYEQPLRVAALLGGGVVILLLGIYDDLRGARAWQKLMIQIPVAVLVWMAGVRIGGTTGPNGVTMALPAWLSMFATVAWIVIVVNAINLIDGLDGLASGLVLESLVITALCAWHREDPTLALFALCLSGSVAGFLVHNFHPASIFMGDSGSMFLGYVLAVATAWTSQKAATLVGVVLPAVALGLPLLDTWMAIVRRMLRGQQILRGDFDHIHHRLLMRGFGQRRSVLLLYGVGALFNALALALIYSAPTWLEWPLVGAAVLGAVAFARWLGPPRERQVEEPRRDVTA